MTASSSRTVEEICSDLGVSIIAWKEPYGPLRTKSPKIIRIVLDRHGEGHLIIVLRTIIESTGNECALIAPVIWAVSDLILAHPKWPDHGLAWIEAFDNIDLLDLARKARANRKAVQKRPAMAAMLYERLAPIFDPPPPPRRNHACRASRASGGPIGGKQSRMAPQPRFNGSPRTAVRSLVGWPAAEIDPIIAKASG